MRVYEIRTDTGALHAIEVENIWVSRWAVARVVRALPGCTVTRWPRRWSLWSDDEFCAFEINGVKFVAWEPFGDNSRFWIGPEEPGHPEETLLVRDAFVRLWRPEWVSAMFLVGVGILGFSLRAAEWEDFGSWVLGKPVRLLGVAAGMALLAWWARDVVRGRYKSQVLKA